MFRFIKEHSYEIVKLFLTQIGISVLGLVLSFATSSNTLLFLFSSIFAAIFYICLLYSEGWELGAKDRPRITNGRMVFDPIKGVRFSLLSNSVNFILVIIMFVALLIGSNIEFFGNTYVIVWYIQRTISAMFMGINTYFSPVQTIEGINYVIPDSLYQPLFYLISVFPSVCAVGLGYFMGAKDQKLFTVKKPD